MDADFAIRPVVHGPPAEPLSILESAEDSLDGLLAGVSSRYLFRRPVHAIGEQNRAAETMRQQALPGSTIEVEWELPTAVALLEVVVDYIRQKLAREPALYLAANLLLIPARFRLIQFHGESAQILQHLAHAGGQTMQLLAGKGSRIFHHTEVLFAMHQKLFGRRPHTRLLAAARRQLFYRSLPQLGRGLVPRQRGDPSHVGFL